MPQVFKASEFAMRAVFDDDYLFKIPAYQRPYAWTTENADELLKDLLKSLREAPEDPYFLGNIILIKHEDAPDSDVVDGQQRLTTLTMLLCVLRELSSSEEYTREIDAFIWQSGNKLKGTQDEYRLSLRERDRDFFRTHVQSGGGIQALLELDRAGRPDTQMRVIENVEHMQTELGSLSEQVREDLTQFVLHQCFLVLVTAKDRDSAYRIFTVMNTRGLDLSPTDILKAEAIGDLEERLQSEYAAKWEELEEELGREKFRELFAHIRMIYGKDKLRVTLQEGFREHVLSEESGPAFIDDVLVPYAKLYELIEDAAFVSTENAEAINRYLSFLGFLDNFDWIPPTMEFFRLHSGSSVDLLRFVKRLDRLAYGLFIRRADTYERIDRYGKLLAEIADGEPAGQEFSAFDFSDTEKAEIRERLAGDIYLVTRARLPLLLRLDGLLADAGASYDHKIITVEHVLPQQPPAESEWLQDFPDEEVREFWTHKLANLVLLARRKNSAASNWDFKRKKHENFVRGGVSPFALTTQVLGEDEWTPKVLQTRQDELLAKLADLWVLN